MTEADHAASFETVLETAELFGLTHSGARKLAREIARVVKGWRKAGARAGLKAKELDRMDSAFEHEDLEAALR